MARRIVVQDRDSKKRFYYDYDDLLEKGLSEKDISFDPKTQRKYYEAYIHRRSKKNNQIRAQRTVKCKSLAETAKAEKKLIEVVMKLIQDEENKGNLWRVLLDRFAYESTKDYEELGFCINPLTGRKIKHKTLQNNISMLKTYTKAWNDIPAGELTRLQGKAVIRRAEEVFESYGSVSRLRSLIQNVYNFGIEEEIISNVRKTPVCGVGIALEAEDSDPEILSLPEVKILLREAKKRKHPWYPIWLHALSTGMRSSELYALRKDNVLFDRGIFKICESWNWEKDEAKETKSKYWRTAPIAKELLAETKRLYKETEGLYLFPRFTEWERGEQAKVLRSFCDEIGITSVRFHALRACFATHLLAQGVDRGRIMSIGGWKTFKSFEVYVRLSGIEDKGATDGLVGSFFDSDEEVLDHATEIFTEEAA